MSSTVCQGNCIDTMISPFCATRVFMYGLHLMEYLLVDIRDNNNQCSAPNCAPCAPLSGKQYFQLCHDKDFPPTSRRS